MWEKGYVEGEGIGLHTSLAWIISVRMRGGQGLGPLRVRHRHEETHKGLRVRDLQGASDFFLSSFLLSLNLLDSYFESPSHGCDLPFNGLLLWRGTPAIRPSNHLPRSPPRRWRQLRVYTTPPKKRGAVESRWLACHKYFVNLNPMRTFTQASPRKNSKGGEPRRVKQTLAMTCGKNM